MMMRMYMAVLAGVIGVSASAGTTYNIPSPNDVGNAAAIAALTNAITAINAANSTGSQILLAPGVYDLSGVTTTIGGKVTGVHLYINTYMRNGLIAGTGDIPGDTILLGGGETYQKGVLYIWATDATKPTVVSNLTITGGYRLGDCGGLYGSTYGGLIMRDCIVSNNYATGLGAGVIRVKAYNCLFADNTSSSKNGGGFWSDTAGLGAQDCVFSNNVTSANGGGVYLSGSGSYLVNCKLYDNVGASASGAYVNGVVSNCVFKSNKPKADPNSNKLGGGLYLLSGECVSCKFFDNAADRGGGMYVNSSSAVVRNCIFEGNKQTGWASGAALFVSASSPLALVSNCVFNANTAASSSRTIISNAELVDCVITNHNISSGYILAGCNMTRCLFADNSTDGNAQHLDIGTAYNTTAVSRTNVNCIVANNRALGINSITDGKKVINCTYYGNYCDSGNYGTTVRNCVCWNSIFTGNTVSGIGADASDVRRNFHGGEVHELYLTNCVFSLSDVAVDADYLSNCKKMPTAQIKFRETESGGAFDIRSSSPAFGAGVWEDWMADAVGPLDFAGRPRVMFGAIDVGALECQLMPGLQLIFR